MRLPRFPFATLRASAHRNDIPLFVIARRLPPLSHCEAFTPSSSLRVVLYPSPFLMKDEQKDDEAIPTVTMSL